MGKKARKSRARLAAAAGIALSSVGTAHAISCTVDGCEGIGDYVWLDTNMDGIQDGGESGLSGVIVNLLRFNGSPTGLSDVTDGSGAYEIRFGFGGDTDFIIEFVLPAGYAFSPQYQGGDDTLDSDADPITGRSGIITFDATPGVIQNNFDIDAGMYVIPVPAAIWLFGSGLLGLVAVAKRKTK